MKQPNIDYLGVSFKHEQNTPESNELRKILRITEPNISQMNEAETAIEH